MNTPLRALLIDDSEEDTDLLLHHLRRNGYEVRWVRVDTADALRAALAGQEWDIALCDYVMPCFSWLAALDILRAEAPNLPVLVVSGQIGEDYPTEVVRAGARDYVRKDNLSRLVAAIQRELADAEAQRSRKRAEAGLRAAESWMQLAVDSAALGQFDYDVRTNALLTSPRWKANLGYAPDEIPDRFEEFERRLHPDDHARVMANVRREVDGVSRFVQQEFRLRHRDGSYHWFLSRSAAEIDESGAVFRVLGCSFDITERKQAEEALRFTQFVVDHMRGAAFWATADGRFVYVNDAACRILGYPRAELLTLRVQDIVPNYADALWAGHWQTLQQEGSLTFEIQHQRKTGETILVEVRTNYVQFGGQGYACAIAHDITEREHTEERLHEQAALLQLAHDAIIVCDPERRVTFWNAGAERTYGWTAAEATGQVLHELLQTVFPTSREDIDALLQEHGEWEGEVTHVRRDGSRIVVASRPSLKRDERGVPSAIVEINRDVTERHRAEAALKESERHLREQTEALPQLVWTCLPDGGCDYLNRQWVDYTGVPEAEQLGSAWLQQLHPDDRDATMAAWQHAVRTGSVYAIYYRIRRADGVYRWFHAHAVPIRDADGAIVKWLGSNTDCDDQKRQEQEIRALNADLTQMVDERTAQLQAAVKELEAFNYSVSHDLRAPLRHIGGFIGALEEDYGPQLPETARQYLDHVRADSQYMDRMIEALLRLSRAGRAAIQPLRIDLTQLAQTAFAALRRENGDRAVEFVIGRLPEVLADPTLVRQVWDNLLSNALKFTRSVAAPRIEVGSECRDGHDVFFVRDNGVGFDVQHAEKLFDVFQRFHAAAEFEGTGIGLSIVKRIVERHGGWVWAESAPGEGATFWFTLGTPVPSA